MHITHVHMIGRYVFISIENADFFFCQNNIDITLILSNVKFCFILDP